MDRAGNIYIADSGNERIRKVTGGTISSILRELFGDCFGPALPAANADVGTTVGLALDAAGNLYMADHSGGCIHKLDNSGMVSTVAGGGTSNPGDGGPATSAALGAPAAVALDASGNLYIADDAYSRIRKVTFASASTVPPKFTASGVANGASFAPGGLIPGSIATVFGTDLTSGAGVNLAASLPLPTQLLNVSVIVNGAEAPIFAVDNVAGQQQINFQVPWSLEGQSNASMQIVNNGAASATVQVPVLAAQPGIFDYSSGGGVYGAILHADFKLADIAHPAAAGETVLIYCTGLGAVSPAQQAGAAAIAASTTLTPTVTIGGLTTTPTYSGLAPAFAGLYQINAAVPAKLGAGNQPVVVTIGGVASNSVLLPVR